MKPSLLIRIAVLVAGFWLIVFCMIAIARAQTFTTPQPPLDEFFTIQRTEWKNVLLAQTPDLAYPVLIWRNGLKQRAQLDYYTTKLAPKTYTFRATVAGDKIEVMYWQTPPVSIQERVYSVVYTGADISLPEQPMFNSPVKVFVDGLYQPIDSSNFITDWRYVRFAGWPIGARITFVYFYQVTPVLSAGFTLVQQKCARCHGADFHIGDTSLVGGLDLRSPDSMRVGGSRGPALVPGDPDNSLMYRFAARPQFPRATPAETLALTTTDDNALGMPPFFPLHPAELATLKDWILSGARALE